MKQLSLTNSQRIGLSSYATHSEALLGRDDVVDGCGPNLMIKDEGLEGGNPERGRPGDEPEVEGVSVVCQSLKNTARTDGVKGGPAEKLCQ